ncbi:unnamed protein product [Gadus morhua 'NCC']
MATTVRALNTSLLLLPYQEELEVSMSTSPTPALWDELCVVTDLCLRLHRSAVQASSCSDGRPRESTLVEPVPVFLRVPTPQRACVDPPPSAQQCMWEEAPDLHGKLSQDGPPVAAVTTVTLHKALTSFITFLQSLKLPVLLAADNAKNKLVLDRALFRCSLTDQSQQLGSRFLDTYLLTVGLPVVGCRAL